LVSSDGEIVGIGFLADTADDVLVSIVDEIEGSWPVRGNELFVSASGCFGREETTPFA